MTFEIVYQDSYDDCDSISVEEDEEFSIPCFDDVSRPCYGGQIIDDDGDVVEDNIMLYRRVRYVLRGDTLYAIGRRGREIPWDSFDPER